MVRNRPPPPSASLSSTVSLHVRQNAWEEVGGRELPQPQPADSVPGIRNVKIARRELRCDELPRPFEMLSPEATACLGPPCTRSSRW